VKKPKKEEAESGDKSNAEAKSSEPAAEDTDKSAGSPAKSPKVGLDVIMLDKTTVFAPL